jgi:hypothetical protein
LLERPEKVSAGELVSEFSWSRVSRQAVVVEEGVQ